VSNVNCVRRRKRDSLAYLQPNEAHIPFSVMNSTVGIDLDLSLSNGSSILHPTPPAAAIPTPGRNTSLRTSGSSDPRR
jgi:hypothetical protein